MNLLIIVGFILNFISVGYGLYKIIENIMYNKNDLEDNVNHATILMVISFSFAMVILIFGNLINRSFSIEMFSKTFQIVGLSWLSIAILSLIAIIIVAFKKATGKKLALKKLFHEVLFSFISGFIISLLSFLLYPNQW